MKPKTLYISDLDGTLLGKDALLDRSTEEKLNSLIEKGLLFTVATARTEATVVQMLRGLNLTVPAVLMNGAVLYDLAKREYVSVESVSEKGKTALLAALRTGGNRGFLYCIEDKLTTYYVNTDAPNAAAFIEERETKYGKRFTKIADFSACLSKNIVYCSVSDKKERLQKMVRALSACKDLNVEFYRDIYCEDYWYLEACSKTASKYEAVKRLRRAYGFDRVVGFGDNLNDLPLFAACDASFAVSNAKSEVRAAASGVIGSNTEGGVAEYLLHTYQSEVCGAVDGTTSL